MVYKVQVHKVYTYIFTSDLIKVICVGGGRNDMYFNKKNKKIVLGDIVIITCTLKGSL